MGKRRGTILKRLLIIVVLLCAVDVMAQGLIWGKPRRRLKPVVAAGPSLPTPTFWWKMTGTDTNTTGVLDQQESLEMTNKPSVATGPTLVDESPYAYLLDGTDDGFHSNTNKNTSLLHGSISAWAKFTDQGTYRCLFGEGARSGAQQELTLTRFSDSSFRFYKYVDPAYQFSINPATPPVTNEWIHFCGTYSNGSVAILYTNGIEVARSATLTLTTNTVVIRAIGQTGHAVYVNPYKGYLDDVRYFNYVIASNEVKAIYDAGRQ